MAMDSTITRSKKGPSSLTENSLEFAILSIQKEEEDYILLKNSILRLSLHEFNQNPTTFVQNLNVIPD